MQAARVDARLLVSAGCVAIWLVTAIRIVALPEQLLMANVVADDALYFALPARHWWEGKGFSFDGLESTNGVQTLWALVVLGITGIVEDRLLVVRTMVATSALCWGLAAVALFRWLRPWSWSAALLAGSGMAWCGVHGRLAFQGMENGLHALVGMCVLLVGARGEVNGWGRREVLWLGFALAAFALSRTEGVLLGFMVGVAMLAGWLGRGAGLGERLRRTILLAAPGIVLVGGNAVLNKLCFDAWVPVSGSVKAFYEEQFHGADMHGGMLASIGWHLRFLVNLALSPLREDVPTTLATWTASNMRPWRNVMWAILAFAFLASLRRRCETPTALRTAIDSRRRFACVGLAYATLHVVMLSVALPHFTEYGTWYFASELTAFWMLVGLLAQRSKMSRVIALALAVCMSVAGSVQACNFDPHTMHMRLRQTGDWLTANAPPNAVVGTLCSGLVGWCAPALHVVNVEGIVNTRRFLDEVLRPARLAEYVDEVGMTWFAESQALASGRNGISWQGNVPASRLLPWRYDRINDKHGYAVWQVLPRGTSFALLCDRRDFTRDRYVELAVAADLDGRFPLVPEADIASALRSHAGHAIARSILATPSDQLLHVLAPREQLPSIGLRDDTVHPEHRLDCAPLPGVVLLGYDRTAGRVRNVDFTAVTLFWSCRARLDHDEAFTLALVAGDGRTLAAHAVAECHGTLRTSSWPVGSVVTETIVMHAPGADDARLVLRRDRDRREYSLTR